MAIATPVSRRISNEELSILDPNRPDGLGVALSALLPLAVMVIGNGILLASGWDLHSVAEPLPFTLPAWLSAAVWIAIFPLWGVARWMVWQKGEAGRRASYWILGLMTWALCLPLFSGSLDLFWTTCVSVMSLLFAVAATARVGQVSRGAVLLMLPSIAWLGFATVLGFAAIAQGWSPGFAATQQGANA